MLIAALSYQAHQASLVCTSNLGVKFCIEEVVVRVQFTKWVLG